MPVVFVHGVNVRKDAEGRYARAEERRNAFLEMCVLPRDTEPLGSSGIRNPYWGDHAATFRWGHGSLPDTGYEAFGFDEDELLPAVSLGGMLAAGEALPPADAVLPWLARRSFEAAVDYLVVVATDPRVQLRDPHELASVARAAGEYAYTHRHGPPDWLSQAGTSELFVDRLAEELNRSRPTGGESVVTAWEDFGAFSGAWDAFRASARRTRRAVTKLERRGFRTFVRDPLHETLARFVGDVLVYLGDRGTRETPGMIVRTILDDLSAADLDRRETGDPLLVLAHSMGGNIVYDILTHFAPELSIDYFVTVGSQVALFEELKLFRASDPTIPNGKSRVDKPLKVGRWLNVFDHSDVLGFATGKVFAETQDFEYDTGALLLGSHSAYFVKPSFYQRLATRIEKRTP